MVMRLRTISHCFLLLLLHRVVVFSIVALTGGGGGGGKYLPSLPHMCVLLFCPFSEKESLDSGCVCKIAPTVLMVLSKMHTEAGQTRRD